jgi:hypothetical protein
LRPPRQPTANVETRLGSVDFRFPGRHHRVTVVWSRDIRISRNRSTRHLVTDAGYTASSRPGFRFGTSIPKLNGRAPCGATRVAAEIVLGLSIERTLLK